MSWRVRKLEKKTKATRFMAYATFSFYFWERSEQVVRQQARGGDSIGDLYHHRASRGGRRVPQQIGHDNQPPSLDAHRPYRRQDDGWPPPSIKMAAAAGELFLSRERARVEGKRDRSGACNLRNDSVIDTHRRTNRSISYVKYTTSKLSNFCH